MAVARTVVTRLAACIYFADMEQQQLPSVLWDMLPVSKQQWYVRQSEKVLSYAENRTDPPGRGGRSQTDRPAR